MSGLPTFEAEHLEDLLADRTGQRVKFSERLPEHIDRRNIHLPIGGVDQTSIAISLLAGLGRSDESPQWFESSDVFFDAIPVIDKPIPDDGQPMLMAVAVLSGRRDSVGHLLRLDNTAPVDAGNGELHTKESSPWFMSIKALAHLALGEPVDEVLERWEDLEAAVPSVQRSLHIKRELVTAIANEDETAIAVTAGRANTARLQALEENPDPFELIDQWNTALLVIAQRSGLAVPADLPTLPVHIAKPQWRE